jgi:cysteine-rich repeat protein
MKHSLRAGIACTLGALFLAAGAGAVNAQVSSVDRACVMAFNKAIRRVAKEQGRIIKKCLKDYAAGSLVAFTPEGCIHSDPDGKLTRAAQKALTTIQSKCTGVTPAFGVTPTDPALVTAVLGQIETIHQSIAANLTTGMLTTAAGASCQAQAAGALFKCADTRVKEFLKCKKVGMKAGAITDAATLASTCLGTGTASQPDPSGKIAHACSTKLGSKLQQNCSGVDLLEAFDRCNASTLNGVTDCLNDESACQLCLMMTSVDGLTRDCDLLDDGDNGNGSCGAECGDGVLQQGETCDDGNFGDLDGCASECNVEGGWVCTGEPSVCTLLCGNGTIDLGETCDDGDATGGDGCSSLCLVETGFSCTGEPSVCTPNCGNGIVQAGEGELCDDSDLSNGDGCSSTCTVEPGYNCAGSPSICTFVCGNGSFQSGESCDDGDAIGGDGCSGVCQIEPGWLCSNQPSLCSPICGDGLIRGNELCDDGDATSADGCSFTCQVETGYTCSGQPSSCHPVCGDGFIRGFENCDDNDASSGDGCSAPFCLQETGYTCTGQPSVCVPNCPDGNIDVPEECDDGDAMSGDGCSSTCTGEAGYACGGTPSVCALTCGNGVFNGSEQCEDGNTVSGDGCSSSCKNEPGWFCPTLLPGACTPFEIFIDTPAHGIFTTAGSITITGHYTTLPALNASVTINGVPAQVVNTVLRTFSHNLSLSQALIFNPVRATLTNTANGDDVHDRIVVIAGDSVPDGMHSPEATALRINDSGLNTMEGLVAGLATGLLDLGTLIPAGTVLADECFITVIGCWGSARVTIANPPPSFSHLTLGMDSVTNAVFGDIDIFNIRIDVFIDGSGLVPDCGLRLTANALQLTGNYALQPMPGDPSNVDVNLVTDPPGVQFNGFNHQFTSGLCDAPIIGDIIQAFLPDIEEFAVNGIRDFIRDPDGGGSADSPIADAIETVLAGISISGPIGAGLGLQLDSPLFTVAEDNNGITLGSNAKFTVSVGGGPGQCIPPPGAPDFTRSYHKAEAFPVFGPNTPEGNDPYGLGICISTSGFNQLLRGQTECGLMRSSLTTIDLDGPGGSPPLAITSTLLSLLVPQFAQLPPATPLRIDITPTLAPIVTGEDGPGGELTELKVAQIQLDIVQPGPETVWLSGALDATLGMDLAFLPDGSGLSITIAPPLAGDVTIAIIGNPLGVNEATVEAVLPAIITPLIPSLAGALSGFPLPQFFGLQLQGVEVSRNGQFMSLFANLTPAP